ncbi:alpha/beta fold hydrolase [Agromyces allii]|uniref:Alpha/beta hydrolase n=1 Tax=Agromyces allii TaxID=393607 RepID=A0ABP5CF09_9MICO|nr:alpha/beta hydrolase [Agromyces allii]
MHDRAEVTDAAWRELRVERPDGAVLAAEVAGDARQPLVLLVAGAECSMDWWRPEFCAAIVERGFRVARYDQRGTGRTTLGRAGERRGGLGTAVDDAIAVLEAVSEADGCRAQAHWLGLSAGGFAVQVVAVEHPELVLSLTLIATRPASPYDSDADLPPVSERMMRAWAEPVPEPDWADEASVIEYHVDVDRAYAGMEFDEAHERAIWTATVRRSPDRHRDEPEPDVVDEPARWRERLAEIRVPTTVLHGTDDPLFPIGNGVALAADIPGAGFVPLDGVGHELPPRAWPPVIAAVAASA